MKIVIPAANRADAPFDAIVASYREMLEARNANNLERRFEVARMCDEEGLFGQKYGYADISHIRRDLPLYDLTTTKVVEVREGCGRHVHDKECNYGKPTGNDHWGCSRHFDDSDWIVTISYGRDNQYRADFGVVGGQFVLWAD